MLKKNGIPLAFSARQSTFLVTRVEGNKIDPLNFLSEESSVRNSKALTSYNIDFKKPSVSDIKNLIELCDKNLIPERSLDWLDEISLGSLMFCVKYLVHCRNIGEIIVKTDIRNQTQKQLKDRVYLEFDLCFTGSIERKLAIIQETKDKLIQLRSMINIYLKWIEDKDHRFLGWLNNHQSASLSDSREPIGTNDTNTKECLIANALYTANEEHYRFEAFTLKAKSAWSQKVYRDKNPEKVSRTYALEVRAINQLNELSKLLGLTKTETIEHLIQETYNRENFESSK